MVLICFLLRRKYAMHDYLASIISSFRLSVVVVFLFCFSSFSSFLSFFFSVFLSFFFLSFFLFLFCFFLSPPPPFFFFFFFFACPSSFPSPSYNRHGFPGVDKTMSVPFLLSEARNGGVAAPLLIPTRENPAKWFA